jgi:hypothetical protein
MGLIANVVANTPILSTWGNAIRDRTIQRFATAAERTSQWPSPPAGALSYLDSDPTTLWIFETTWKRLVSNEKAHGGEWYRTTGVGLGSGTTHEIAMEATTTDTDGFLVGGYATIPAGLGGLYTVTWIAGPGASAGWGTFVAGVRLGATGANQVVGATAHSSAAFYPILTVTRTLALPDGMVVRPTVSAAVGGTLTPIAPNNQYPRGPMLSIWRQGAL